MIREVTSDELMTAALIGEKFWAEGALPGSINPDIFCKNWKFILDSKIGIIFGLYEDGVMVGAIGGLISPDLNNGDKVMTEAFWFIQKESRGGGIKLLLNFLKYAKEIGCVRVLMMHLFNEHASKICKIYKKMGFKPVETHYVLTI